MFGKYLSHSRRTDTIFTTIQGMRDSRSHDSPVVACMLAMAMRDSASQLEQLCDLRAQEWHPGAVVRLGLCLPSQGVSSYDQSWRRELLVGVITALVFYLLAQGGQTCLARENSWGSAKLSVCEPDPSDTGLRQKRRDCSSGDCPKKARDTISSVDRSLSSSRAAAAVGEGKEEKKRERAEKEEKPFSIPHQPSSPDFFSQAAHFRLSLLIHLGLMFLNRALCSPAVPNFSLCNTNTLDFSKLPQGFGSSHLIDIMRVSQSVCCLAHTSLGGHMAPYAIIFSMYLLTLVGNGLLIVTAWSSQHLQTLLHFFFLIRPGSVDIGFVVIFTQVALLLTGRSASRKPLLGSKSPDLASADPDPARAATPV
ncbi:hypothetical protein QYF61_022383 [Mycteria americana]|uniref:Uncharacterized protein n=1 Tax=Mycteria americana TaxID=33587 RepID=A0AAN7RJS1_MYCAM|nr:hypothetical protein QYF61_022383 [Mycteria americana]